MPTWVQESTNPVAASTATTVPAAPEDTMNAMNVEVENDQGAPGEITNKCFVKVCGEHRRCAANRVSCACCG